VKGMMKTILLFAALTVSLCGVGWGQVENELAQKSKPATADNVVGTWKMAYQVVRPSVKTDSLFFAGFQIFEFFKDGYVKNLAASKDLDIEKTKMYLEAMPRKTTYSFAADGLLVINRSLNDFDNIMISVITDDITEPLRKGAPLLKKGDLILSYLDPDKKPYMQRYLRKISLR